MPIPAKKIIRKKFDIDNFQELEYLALDDSYQGYLLDQDCINNFKILKFSLKQKTLQQSIALQGEFYNQKHDEFETLKLLPIANTILRKVNFKSF